MTYTQGTIISTPTSNTVTRDLQKHTRLERHNKLLYATISPHKYQKPKLIQAALTKSVVASQRKHCPCTKQLTAG